MLRIARPEKSRRLQSRSSPACTGGGGEADVAWILRAGPLGSWFLRSLPPAPMCPWPPGSDQPARPAHLRADNRLPLNPPGPSGPLRTRGPPLRWPLWLVPEQVVATCAGALAMARSSADSSAGSPADSSAGSPAGSSAGSADAFGNDSDSDVGDLRLSQASSPAAPASSEDEAPPDAPAGSSEPEAAASSSDEPEAASTTSSDEAEAAAASSSDEPEATAASSSDEAEAAATRDSKSDAGTASGHEESEPDAGTASGHEDSGPEAAAASSPEGSEPVASETEDGEADGASDGDEPGKAGLKSKAGAVSPASGSSSDSSSSSSSSIAQGDAVLTETLEEHMERHGYPLNVKSCPSCRFAHNREKWERQATYQQDGVSRTWLTWHSGFLGCFLCKAAGLEIPFAKGKASAKLDRVRRHQKTTAHADAVTQWCAAGSVPGLPPVAGKASAWPTALSYAHILFTRVLVQVGGSFRDFARWSAAARVAGARGLENSLSRKIPAHLVEVMAEQEQALTSKLVGMSAVSGIAFDGRAQVWAVMWHLVLWRWPSGVSKTPLPSGVTALNGERGPWIANRIAGAPQLGADHSGAGKTRATIRAVHSSAQSEECKGHLRETLQFSASDGAADAQLVSQSLPVHFPALRFRCTDTSHANMLVLKNAFGGDPEIDMVDQLLVSGKKPPSLSKFLSTSGRFREMFKEEEAQDAVQVLAHFGWAPQRYTSKVRPYSRTSRRLRQAFAAVSSEATGGDAKRRVWARHLLRELGGCHSSRLLLGGMLADLSFEHCLWVRPSDKTDPDHEATKANKEKFLARLDLLFTEGLILTPACKDTFTGQVLDFLREPRILRYGRSAMSVGLPYLVPAGTAGPTGAPAPDDPIWEPLDRIRNLVVSLRELVKAYRPEQAWQDRLHAFRLPSPWGPGSSFATLPDDARQNLRTEVQADLRSMLAQSGADADDVEAGWVEFLRLLPAAEAHQRAGSTVREAWAWASCDFPEFKAGRAAVNLLLGATCTTGAVERLFREVPVQEREDRSHMLEVTLENLLLASQAPAPEDFSQVSPELDGTGRIIRKGAYMPQIAKRYVEKIGAAPRLEAPRKRRRDAGISRDEDTLKKQRLERGDPQGESEFTRERAQAIAALESQPAADRRRHLEHSVFGGAAVPSASADRLDQYAGPKVQALREKARAKAEARAAGTAAGPKRKRQVARSAGQPWATKKRGSGPRPGVILILRRDPAVEATASRKGFRLSFRAEHFVEACLRFRQRGNVVLEPAQPANLQVVAGFTARLAGAFLSPEAGWQGQPARVPVGVKFLDGKAMGRQRAVALSAGIDGEFPELTLIWEALSRWRNARFEMTEVKKLQAAFRKDLDKNPRSRPWARKRILMTPAELAALSQQSQDRYPGLFNAWPTFLEFLGDVEAGAVCPGDW